MVVSEARIESWNPALALKLAPLVRLDDDQLFDFCQLNRDLRIERDAEGVLLLMAPAGGASSARNLEVCRQLGNWAERDGSGIAFDSSVGFILPNGAMRSPDAAWVRRERWEALTADQREKFPPRAALAVRPPGTAATAYARAYPQRHAAGLAHRSDLPHFCSLSTLGGRIECRGLLVSNQASAMRGTVVNLSGGIIADSWPTGFTESLEVSVFSAYVALSLWVAAHLFSGIADFVRSQRVLCRNGEGGHSGVVAKVGFGGPLIGMNMFP